MSSMTKKRPSSLAEHRYRNRCLHHGLNPDAHELAVARAAPRLGELSPAPRYAELCRWLALPCTGRPGCLCRDHLMADSPGPGAELTGWRNAVADSACMGRHMVLHNRVVAAIARHKPASLDELAAVPGMGPAKLGAHGHDILAVVAKWRASMAALAMWSMYWCADNLGYLTVCMYA